MPGNTCEGMGACDGQWLAADLRPESSPLPFQDSLNVHPSHARFPDAQELRAHGDNAVSEH